MDIAAIEDDVRGHLTERSLPAFGLQVDDVVVRVGPRALGGAPRGDLDPDEPVVVRGGGGPDGRRPVGSVYPGHEPRMRGRDTSAGVREKGMRRRADVDPVSPR